MPKRGYRRPAVDSHVTAFEERVAPLLQREPRRAADRRRVAQENDARMCAALGIAPIDVATAEHRVAVDGHLAVRVRVYWPTPEPAEPGAGLPVLLYFYGGGFTIGGIDWVSWDARFRERARDAGIIVVAADYARAPEARFPTQPEQCWSALEWVFAHAAELGGSPERLAIGGASSGGNLAAATTLLNRERRCRPIRLQLLENPVVDLTMGHADMRGIGPSVPGVILRRMGRLLVRQYLGPRGRTARNPLASPILATSHAGLPPAWICTSELDPLRGDGEAYGRALAVAGVPVSIVRYIGQTHTSLGWDRFIPGAAEARRAVIARLRALHDGEPDPALDSAPASTVSA
ncbi:alpha/beta hydrolase [Microbacterium sp. NPDC056052]|uniref:alpha/beta hydrolase n=1 Tax=Microbacterium sp. NPDC056052 TaxID=3345695 RepID=UPI0035E3536C